MCDVAGPLMVSINLGGVISPTRLDSVVVGNQQLSCTKPIACSGEMLPDRMDRFCAQRTEDLATHALDYARPQEVQITKMLACQQDSMTVACLPLDLSSGERIRENGKQGQSTCPPGQSAVPGARNIYAFIRYDALVVRLHILCRFVVHVINAHLQTRPAFEVNLPLVVSSLNTARLAVGAAPHPLLRLAQGTISTSPWLGGLLVAHRDLSALVTAV